jgi:hypothetical protein
MYFNADNLVKYKELEDVVKKKTSKNMEETTEKIWEIEADCGKKFFCRKVWDPRSDDESEEEMVEIVNHRKEKGKEGELLTLWRDGQREWYPFLLTKKDGERLVERYMRDHSLTNELMGVEENVKNKNTNSKKKNKKISNKKEMKKPPIQQNESVTPRQLDAVLCGSEYINLIFFFSYIF